MSTANDICTMARRPTYSLLNKHGLCGWCRFIWWVLTWWTAYSWQWKELRLGEKVRYGWTDTRVDLTCWVRGHKLAWANCYGPTRYYCPRCFHEFGAGEGAYRATLYLRR